VALIRKEINSGYRKQLDKIGFHSIGAENFKSGLLQTYPMDFIQLFNSWYKDNDKAEDVSALFQFSKKREMQL
jgi:hypothetical protein